MICYAPSLYVDLCGAEDDPFICWCIPLIINYVHVYMDTAPATDTGTAMELGQWHWTLVNLAKSDRSSSASSSSSTTTCTVASRWTGLGRRQYYYHSMPCRNKNNFFFSHVRRDIKFTGALFIIITNWLLTTANHFLDHHHATQAQPGSPDTDEWENRSSGESKLIPMITVTNRQMLSCCHIHFPLSGGFGIRWIFARRRLTVLVSIYSLFTTP